MKVAVVGATGLVGTVMLKVLEERNFPVTELFPVASEKSVGKEITFKGKKYKVISMYGSHRTRSRIWLFFQPVGVLPWNGHRNLPKQGRRLWTIPQPGEWIRPRSWWFPR